MRHVSSTLVVLLLLGTGARDARTQETPVPVPVTGRDLHLVLADGERLSGELIEADARRLLLWGTSGLRTIDYADLGSLEARRHGFGARQAWLWVGLGALLTGAGMTAACAQVEDTSCGEVFAAFTITWAVVGGLFAGSIASGQYASVQPNEAALRPLARFPQGAPPAFVESNRAVARPPR